MASERTIIILYLHITSSHIELRHCTHTKLRFAASYIPPLMSIRLQILTGLLALLILNKQKA